MNILMIGHGMMGTWHSEALAPLDVCLHTLVGRRPEPTAEFASRFGYRKWTVDLKEALADSDIDAAIIANPSECHAETALACIAAGKPTLVEIPIAMNIADAERVVRAAEQRQVTLGIVHPIRFQPGFEPLRERIRAGQEHIRHYAGRFFIHRLENVGVTGYRRSWTDNLLWHHITHLLDFGLWMLDLESTPLRAAYSFMPAVDARTGIPMETVIAAETETDQSLVVTGSYYGRERLFDILIVTNRDSYRLDIFKSLFATGAGEQVSEREQSVCARLTQDFIEALAAGRQPRVSGRSVLPAMRMLQAVQDKWDAQYGVQSLPGRPL
ncbi:MAG: Gfo/Idh/MocA family oxidoreductase [Gammaproteobacteria bacterium]